jgi:hypothetical protein
MYSIFWIKVLQMANFELGIHEWYILNSGSMHCTFGTWILHSIFNITMVKAAI